MAFQWLTLLLEERQEVQRVEDHVGLLVGSLVPRDHLGPGADDDLADIPADLHLVVGVGDRHRVVIATVAHHRDRCGAGAELLAGVVGRRRQRHQRVEIPQHPLADRLGMPPEYRVLPLEALLFQHSTIVLGPMADKVSSFNASKLSNRGIGTRKFRRPKPITPSTLPFAIVARTNGAPMAHSFPLPGRPKRSSNR
jgi:hypothetical protein